MITGGNIYQVTDGSGNIVCHTIETLFGIHTDSKPTNVGNGSAFIEMDTSKLYFFDAENTTWCEWGASE